MHFARVIGTVVCTEKVTAFKGHRMLLITPVDSRNSAPGRPLVAIDLVSAAPGQHVFYVRGREAANALPNPDNPADAAIVGIVDDVREETRGGAVKTENRPDESSSQLPTGSRDARRSKESDRNPSRRGGSQTRGE